MAFSKILDLIRKGDFAQAKADLLSVINEGNLQIKDVDVIKKYYNKSNSPYVAYILYKSQCCCGLRLEALDTYIKLLQQCSRKRDVSILDMLVDTNNEEIQEIYEAIINKLSDDIDIPQSIIVSDIVDVIVPVIWEKFGEEKYNMISRLAELIWFEDLKNSEHIYILAYSCERANSELAEKLYLKLIQKEPANAEALNNIGLLYEKKTDYAKARFYFSKAYMFCDSNKTYKKNLDRIMAKK